MIVDLNRTEFLPNEFMLENTNHIFTWVIDGNEIFDLTEHKLYNICDIANDYYDFHFYKNKNDEDFLGVWEII